MILSLPVEEQLLRESDGTLTKQFKVVPGFARVYSEQNRIENDGTLNPTGHLLISNPLIEWAIDMTNRSILGINEEIWIRLHTQPDSDPILGDGGTHITDNTIVV